MARWAVFDVDGTLLPGDSMEARFIKRSIRRGMISPAGFLGLLENTLKFFFRGNLTGGLKGDKSLLKGLPFSRVETEAAACFSAEIAPRLSRRGKETIKRCREEGYRILLMTGSPDFLARHLLPVLQPDQLISAEMEIANGCLTGKVKGLHPYGEAKQILLLRAQRQLQIDFSASVVFANHHSDAAHMELFGRAVAVNPGRKLERIARARGWEIEYWG